MPTLDTNEQWIRNITPEPTMPTETPLPAEKVELLPCPFCGGKAAWGEGEQKTRYGNEQAYCTNCYAMTAPEGTKAKAARSWNTRATAQPTPASATREGEQEQGLWHEAATIVQACLNVHSTYSDAEREFAAHLIEVFNTRDQHPDYKHRNSVRAYPAAASTTPATEEQGAPQRVRVVVRAATADDWIGVAYCKDYAGDPSTIHEYVHGDRHAKVVAAATLALEWFAGFPHEGSASGFDTSTAADAYDRLRAALHPDD